MDVSNTLKCGLKEIKIQNQFPFITFGIGSNRKYQRWTFFYFKKLHCEAVVTR